MKGTTPASPIRGGALRSRAEGFRGAEDVEKGINETI